MDPVPSNAWQGGDMCGRYASARAKQELLEEFEVELDGAAEEELRPDYNVAPTKPVYAVMSRGAQDEIRDGRAVRQLQRGPVGPGPGLGEGSVHRLEDDQRAGGDGRREAVVPQGVRGAPLPAPGGRLLRMGRAGRGQDGKGTKPKKQPYFIQPADGGVMAMAGLYEFWRDRSRADDDPLAWLVTCAVITTSAEDELGRIHDRMPMLIEHDRWADWLDPGAPTRGSS